MMRILLLTFCTLLCFTGVSHAQQATAPEEIQGRWDFPMCRFSELYFTISKHFTMRADRNAAFFERLDSIRKDRGHYMVDDHKKLYALQKGPGVNGSTEQLEFYYLMDDSEAARRKFEKDPINPKNGQELKYQRCPKDALPDWAPNLGARMNSLALLDSVYEACGDKVIMGNEPCQRTIFESLPGAVLFA